MELDSLVALQGWKASPSAGGHDDNHTGVTGIE